MFVLANMWFQTLMRQFFFNIDKIVFNFISIIYDFLISIARTSILSQADILDMTGRIYKLLAVFMIFKVTFSLIMYVVNPDDFSDKNKGVSKLGLNIIISLALLILTPYIFSYAYQLQTIILEDNALSALIFGDENDAANESAFNTAGDSMAYITMTPFFTPNAAISELYECSQLTVKEDNKAVFNKSCSGMTKIDSGYVPDTDDENSLYALTKEGKNSNFTEQTLVNYIAGVNEGNLSLMFRQDMAIAKTPDGLDYIMDYKYIFSTVTGVVVILLLLTFCLDVALRSIKLAFLQLIAPIPIISFVDPKSGKDGMFKKWYEMCFKTYISLFIRLLAIYFVAYIVSRLDKMVDIVDGSYVTSAIVKIFVIIGALMFAKQLPKILEGLGIKLDGDGKFTLNPLKKFENEALGGKKILGFAGAAGAAGLAGAANFGTRLFDKNNWKNKNGNITAGSLAKGLLRVPGSAIAGATSAAYRGTRKALKGEGAGKVFASSYGEAMFAKLQREDLNRKGSTFLGRRAADAARHLGVLNAAQQQTLDLATLDGEKKSRMDDLKLKREQTELNKQKMITERNNKTKVHNDNKTHLNAINQNISSLKNDKVNVIDKDKRVNDLKASGQYYAKIGDKIHEKTEDGKIIEKIVDEEMLKNNPDGIKTDEARIADEQLDREKVKALEWLKENDEDTKNRIKLLDDNGIKISDNPKEIKKEMANQDASIRAITSSYYAQEESYKEQEENYKLEEKRIEDWYKQEVKDRHLDKDSAEWIANEADNAARGIKNPQPEGFKPTASVDTNTYTPFTTGVILGNGPQGGAPSGHHGPHGGSHGPHGH